MTFLFAIPITVALIHTLISSNIVYTLLNMLGLITIIYFNKLRTSCHYNFVSIYGDVQNNFLHLC